MNWFLDMCIIIFYASDSKDIFSEKSKEFVKNKGKNKYFLCVYITKENMPKWILRQKTILSIIKQKIHNPLCEIERLEEYKQLFSKDIIVLKKRLAQYASSPDKQGYYHKLKRNQEILLRSVNYFLTKLIDQEVIPVKEIDFELKSTLFTFLQNHSDAVTLASGIQCHNKIEEIIILTGDKKDWTKDNLQWTFDSKPSLPKTYPKIPEIKYIQDL